MKSSKLKNLFLILALFVSGAVKAQNFNEVIKAVASDRGANAQFGGSVSISGNYAIVGAINEQKDIAGNNPISSAGAAYIYERDASGNWIEVQKLTSTVRSAFDFFGASVSISGTYAIVGAYNDDEDSAENNRVNDAGAAYIYERNSSGTWVLVQKIVASDRFTGDVFGYSVAISGSYVIVGSWFEDEDITGVNTLTDAGAAYIFERNATGVWTEVQKIVPSDRGARDGFGISLSIDGSYVIVGASQEDEDIAGGNTLNGAGSAYVFERNAMGVWTEVQKIVASDRGTDDEFGFSVSISGNYAIAGARSEDQNSAGLSTQSNAGSAYIFERNSSGTWGQVQKIVASDRARSDEFGYSVAISGSYSIVGARFEDEDETGSNTLSAAGSAYVFQRDTSGSWTEFEKIVSSDRGTNDRLGISVAISGNYAIAGAPLEQEDSLGNNTLISAGSAYIFDGTPTVKATISAKTDNSCFGGNTGSLVVVATMGTANYSYNWSNGFSTSNTASTTDTLKALVAGSYSVTITDALGDTSIATAIITEPALISSSISETACDSYTWSLNNMTYTSSGSYIDTLRNAAGCDSVVTLNLTINNSTSSSLSETACEAFTWPLNNMTYTTSGAYNDTLTNAIGCDSIITLNLTILDATSSSFSESACGSYTWPLNNMTYTSSGAYNDTLRNAAGCDSIITLNLTITNVDVSLSATGPSITANAVGASYQWLDCDQNYLVMTGDTSQLFTATANGNYAVEVTQNSCVDTSDCVQISTVGIDGNMNVDEIFIYPNPLPSGQSQLNIDMGNLTSMSVKIFNVNGVLVYDENEISSSKHTIDMELPAGVYIIEVNTREHRQQFRLIRN